MLFLIASTGPAMLICRRVFRRIRASASVSMSLPTVASSGLIVDANPAIGLSITVKVSEFATTGPVAVAVMVVDP